jgi:hypothetical protein
MENIAHGTVVEDHDFTQVGFDLCQILDVCAIAKCAVLAVVSAAKVFAFAFDPVDDGICVLLHRCSENDEIVPFADLRMAESVKEKQKAEISSHLAQEVMAVWALVDIVQYRYLRTKNHAISSNGALKLNFDHVTSAHPTAFCHTVNQRLIQVDNKSLLGRVRIISHDIRGLTARNQRPRRSRSTWISELCGGRV